MLINPAASIDLLQFLDVNEHVGEGEDSLIEKSLEESKERLFFGGDCREAGLESQILSLVLVTIKVIAGVLCCSIDCSIILFVFYVFISRGDAMECNL